MTLHVTLRVTLFLKGSLASPPYTLDFSEKCEGVRLFCKNANFARNFTFNQEPQVKASYFMD